MGQAASIKARPVAARAAQRRQHALLITTAIIFMGMIVIRGDVIMNLRTMYPTALEANAMVSALTSVVIHLLAW